MKAGIFIATIGVLYGMGILWWWAIFGMSEKIATANIVTTLVFIFAGWIAIVDGADL